ncbi:putative WD repeat-containing protein 59 [Apostichopus japonicus]|uniref:Putative WD repeat-containing protein 59 n=1 Tax=Stichopus japonicus TaxID=307972 RepID=A0A2G8LAW7_STIJA|nr:putative WD repeat-containing protein 59 [Apostichopus japonicus]
MCVGQGDYKSFKTNVWKVNWQISLGNKSDYDSSTIGVDNINCLLIYEWASALALDCTGQLALLAGRLNFDVIKLDHLPNGKVVCIPRKSKMKLDVSAAEWNPHRSHSLVFAVASNQVVEIYNSVSDEWTLDLTLKAHTRVISDLNWSGFDPCLLATCSVDTYTYLWDTREPKKPCMEFSAIAGAGQVKWNKKNADTLATVHEGGIRLWDKRKGNQTVQCISAHPSKIHGLDWSPTEENHLATAAQDGTAKIWDITDHGKSKDELRTDSALWRIRYAPFGDGILTLMLPQIRQVDKMLFLWSQSNLSSPVFSFTGHEDNILDFHWRKMKEGSTDYQLVTWSRDRKLLIWRIEPHIQRVG